MVDFKALKDKYNKQKKADDQIFAVVLGQRGKGKSGTSAGTWGKDTKVLHLAFLQEDHGISSAMGVAKNKENIIPVLVDVDDAGNKMSADDAWASLMRYLSMDLTGIDVLVLDGLSSIDVVIASHTRVTTAKGFDGKKNSDLLFDELLSMLKKISLKNKDVVITCSTEMRIGPEGLFVTPSLRGGSAINTIIGAAPEILMMDKIETEKGIAFVFDFNGLSTQKSGKKMSGETYVLAVEPRIAGVPTTEIPAQMVANFAYLKKFKREYLNKKEN